MQVQSQGSPLILVLASFRAVLDMFSAHFGRRNSNHVGFRLRMVTKPGQIILVLVRQPGTVKPTGAERGPTGRNWDLGPKRFGT